MDQPPPGGADPDLDQAATRAELRRDEGDTSYILRLDRGKLYVINHAEKTYSEMAVRATCSRWPRRRRSRSRCR